MVGYVEKRWSDGLTVVPTTRGVVDAFVHEWRDLLAASLC
jgi:hypothetical protein